MSSSNIGRSKAAKQAENKQNIRTLERYLETAIIGIQESGIQLDYSAMGRYFGITPQAASLRYYRARNYVNDSIKTHKDTEEEPKNTETKGND
ncbi:hypothetical protein N7457_003634 [Penicillium paradoxum]|uniref:uncharacterized protein n=1 Tax=Penicillium paradoxum TaxID=176176 RepID=UPI0025476650|nr:uncharacterized protein N7457_003634 [Penicillium paradoxum]KAJ5788644.1 hypothetical protein N7457_003634 [Penicillium paradoxum]